MEKSLNFSLNNKPNVSLSEAARLMGSIRSDKKAKSSKKNGKKGGRPKKVK